jgi:hypothetical protein
VPAIVLSATWNTMKETDQNVRNDLIPLADASAIYGFSHAYLANLARNGRLKAQKLGSIWVTTPVDIEAYIRSRKRIGVFREDVRLVESPR